MRKLLENGSTAVRDFMFLGHAVITVRKEPEMVRFTYRITENEQKTMYFVNMFYGGTPGDRKYTYLGIVNKRNGMFTATAASKGRENTPGFRMFSELFEEVKTGRLTQDNPTFKVWHEGVCGVCGKKLTVPESIESGIGPECGRRLRRKSRKLSEAYE